MPAENIKDSILLYYELIGLDQKLHRKKGGWVGDTNTCKINLNMKGKLKIMFINYN